MKQIGTSRANIFLVTTCLIVVSFFFTCESPAENTPYEVVDAFLKRIQLLSKPIYEKRNGDRLDSEDAAMYNKARNELPELFEDEEKGRLITMGFLFGKFDSYRISSVEVQDDTAEVEAQIFGSRFLGIRVDGEEKSPSRVRFGVVRRGHRWYIRELLPTPEAES